MPIGQEIRHRKWGTFGWEMDPVPGISVPESDIYGLTLIGNFMEENLTDVSICIYYVPDPLRSHPPGWPPRQIKKANT
jgi:hypothetical protein